MTQNWSVDEIASLIVSKLLKLYNILLNMAIENEEAAKPLKYSAIHFLVIAAVVTKRTSQSFWKETLTKNKSNWQT